MCVCVRGCVGRVGVSACGRVGVYSSILPRQNDLYVGSTLVYFTSKMMNQGVRQFRPILNIKTVETPVVVFPFFANMLL